MAAPWDPRLDEVLALAPAAARGLRELQDRLATDAADPVVVELCRLRSAMLLDVPTEFARRSPAAVAAGLDEATVDDLPRWPSSPRFDERTRAALAFTEAFLMGSEVARDQLPGLRARFDDDEVFALGVAVAFHEGIHLLHRALGASHPAPTDEEASR